MPEKYKLQCEISHIHKLKLDSLCEGRKIHGLVIEKLIDLGCELKFTPVRGGLKSLKKDTKQQTKE